MTFLKCERYCRRLLVITATHPRQEGTTKQPDDKLDLAVYDYHVYDTDASALTLVFTHGTSFNKDLWHFIIDILLTQPELKGLIRRVVAIDSANHGDSAVLNRDKLAAHAFWPDNAYDILTAIQTLGLSQPLVGIGHSFGGGIMAHAAMMSQTSFIATIFIDPILFLMPEQDQMAAKNALCRRTEWSSIEEVKSAFSRSKGLADWHPRQRDVYAQFGTMAAPSGNETGLRILKTPKEQEAATYIAGPVPELVELLKCSSAQHNFILGAKSAVLSQPQRDEIGRAARNKGGVHLMGDAGHLIPLTHPCELADVLKRQLVEIYNNARRDSLHKL